MNKTVRELIEMYNDGKLHVNQSTQRKFLYANEKISTEFGESTKAGWVITSILDKNIQLPALFFWRNSECHQEDEYNIHDGKQRFLSIKYFIDGSEVAYINGEEKKFVDLTDDLKNKLYDYSFDITVREGTSREEEESFMYINSNSMPLTEYESIRGAFHGKFFDEFEKYIDENLSTQFDSIKKVNRGEQAIWLLYLYFGLIGENKKSRNLKLIDKLEYARNSEFKKDKNNFTKIVETFNRLTPNTNSGTSTDKNPEKMWKLSAYIVTKYRSKIDDIISYYIGGYSVSNDIKKWKFDVHKTAIDALIQRNIRCSYIRYFDNQTKIALYERSHKCARCGEKFAFNELEVDHIIPWSEGGKTDIENAQLMCKSCNASKGGNNRDE